MRLVLRMHKSVPHMSGRAYRDRTTWLRAQLPFYPPQLIDHMKPVNLDWESFRKKVI